MQYQYGFELEGFAVENIDGEPTIVLPPSDWPTDGFPGLVEIRTRGGADIKEAYWSIIRQTTELPEHPTICFDGSRHWYSFSAKERVELRRRGYEAKEPADYRNLYGKAPRDDRGRTTASFQINISLLTHPAYNVYVGKERTPVQIPAKYGLLDIPRIVRALDETFRSEIRLSNRQPGCYAIKEDRLEYRSLPNFVFPYYAEWNEVAYFWKQITDAVENS